jgi:acetyl-CoA C-acetyltransferase
MKEKNSPIIVGAAQFTQSKQVLQPLDPLSLMVKTSQMAISDIGVNNLKDLIDTVYMVNINGWSYKDAPSELSKLLGINPVRKIYLPSGGESPQMLVNRAAKAIASGESQVVLITGGEAAYSAYRADTGKITLNWPKRRKPKYMEASLFDGINPFENKYGLWIPSCSYAIFENAIRAESKRSVEEHNRYMGKLFEHYSKIASNNPFAWTQKSYTAEEITTPSPENRKVAYPYTKRMCSNVFVDQSGALILTSEKIASKLKIDENRWVYLMGSADLRNILDIIQRPQLYNSPAAREGSKLALEQAGLKLEEIDLFDIYSCFPSIVQIIRKEIGLSEKDSRDLTVTGGLPYFGGPMSNYSMHSIITSVGLIRKNSSLKIMVVANGGYNTKQSFGIYGKKPPVKLWNEHEEEKIQKSILSKALQNPIEKANGQLTVESYTIIYDKVGNPEHVLVIGHLENNQRTVARVKGDPENLLKLEQNNFVGKSFPVYYDSKIDRNIINIDA